MRAEPRALAPLPLLVVTGFLGSGKTTLLNALLKRPAFADAAVLINEFGEIALDHVLVSEAREELVVLASGCVCCSLRADLVTQLESLLAQRERGELPRFSRIVLETTGLADPVPVIQTLLKHPALCEALYLDGIVCTVDAQHGELTLRREAEAQKQVSIADRLLLTKVDLCDRAQIARVRAVLAALHPGAPILHSRLGEVDEDYLSGLGHLDTRAILRAAAHHPGPAAGHDLERVSALSVGFDAPLDFSSFALWVSLLTQLHGAHVLRLKAVISARGEPHPLAVQAVQHVVYPTLALPHATDLQGKSQVVLLTSGLSADVREALRTQLVALASDAWPQARG
jgi:G3E family GTPase